MELVLSIIEERANLERISRNSLYASGPNAAMVGYSFEIVRRHLTGNTILEMGPAEGIMTELLVGTNKSITLVEGSGYFCKELRARFPQATVINALFEQYEPEVRFDNIILGHVLEHVENPVEILNKARQWLKPNDGRLFAAVPNARSLHRQAAVIMGILPEEDALNEMDVHHGHRRVFNPESFRSNFVKAGLRIDIFGGYWLKPVANKQIETSWTDEMLRAFMQLGERYPDIAAEIYVVASVSE